MNINSGDLNKATLSATVADDFTSQWEVTDGDSKKWIVNLPDFNPETRKKFTSKDNVKEIMDLPLRSNPNYWEPYLTAEELKAANTPNEAVIVRDKRDALLKKYEWTVNSPDLDDSKKAEWKTYRQSLRDLPAQSGFPWESDGMSWPVKPL